MKIRLLLKNNAKTIGILHRGLDDGLIVCVDKNGALVPSGSKMKVVSCEEIIGESYETPGIIVKFLAGHEFTLEDVKPEVKPKTKVEYVKCEDTIFNLRKDFEDGDLYTKIHEHDFDCMVKISCSHVLSCNLYDEVAYRRVETEVTWIDEVNETLYNHGVTLYEENGSIVELDGPLDKQAFIEMCSFVHNANK